MAIPLENMVGYIRTRRKPGARNGTTGEEVELWIDPKVKMKTTAGGPVVSKPDDCTGILYGKLDADGKPTGQLEVLYPEE